MNYNLHHHLPREHNIPSKTKTFVTVVCFYWSKIVRILNNSRGYEFPWWQIENWETWEQAIMREFNEETWMHLQENQLEEIIHIWNSYKWSDTKNLIKVYIWFISSLDNARSDVYLYDKIPPHTTIPKKYLTEIISCINNYMFKEHNEKFWNKISDTYEITNTFSYNDFHFWPMLPWNSLLQIIKNISWKKILDLWCWMGHNAIYLAKQNAIVTALDISISQLQIMKSLSRKAWVNIHEIQWDLNTINIQNQKFS